MPDLEFFLSLSTVLTASALAIALLPWRQEDHEQVEDAFQALLELPGLLVRAAQEALEHRLAARASRETSEPGYDGSPA